MYALTSSLVFVTLLAGHVVDSQICPGTTCSCPSATTIIDCSNRGLTAIPKFEGLFSGDVELLDFSGNDLVTFDTNEFGNSFRAVGVIELIDLSNNRLTSIPNSFGVPNQVPSYDALNLSSNNFDTFPRKAIPEQFPTVNLLIDISNNQLTSLGNNIISENDEGGIPNLRFIARNNLIETIEIMAFANAGINELYLDIRDNRLTNISQDLYFPISPNRAFNMSGNPWNCDCNLRWILKSDFKDISRLAPPTCDQPEPLRGMALFDLQADEFVCAPMATETEPDVVINNGDNNVSCPVAADPESTLGITWQFDLNCPDNGTPLTITAQSKVAILQDVTCFPQSNITCTGSNYAGSIDIPLAVITGDDVGACPDSSGGNGRRGASGGFVFLIILVILSLLACLVIGAYYVFLLREHVWFER